jgi:NitT/TauT family transport system ATP-binding protein
LPAIGEFRTGQPLLPADMKLSFNAVAKRFGGLRVIDDFTHEFAEGELVALVGPSGCGKSTLLHLAAGLEAPTGGEVLADGRQVRGPHPERTLMFQENALFPWLTLAQNIALALEFQKVDRRTARARALRWLSKVSLDGFADYYPHQVSGGMRQRAALARAFIAEPRALLLDEPFGALDALTRMTLQDALRDLIREQAPTVLLVTHDVDEAIFLADHILVFGPRPATVLKAFSLERRERTHDLSGFSDVRSEILRLLGIEAEQVEPSLTSLGA